MRKQEVGCLLSATVAVVPFVALILLFSQFVSDSKMLHDLYDGQFSTVFPDVLRVGTVQLLAGPV